MRKDIFPEHNTRLNKRSHHPRHHYLHHCYLCADVITSRIRKGARSSGDSSEQYVIKVIRLHVHFNLFFPSVARNLKGKILPDGSNIW